MRTWLKNLRADRSQENIARLAGITQQMYSWIERGDRTPSVDVAKRIALVLGFEWTMFFEDEFQSTPPALRATRR